MRAIKRIFISFSPGWQQEAIRVVLHLPHKSVKLDSWSPKEIKNSANCLKEDLLMSQQPKTIATFATPEEAHMALNVLQNAGIVSYLEDTNVSGALGLPGSMMCEVKLQVAEEDEARALEVLAEETVVPQGETTPDRICPKCGSSLPPGFDVCWSCESPKDNDS